MTFITDMRSTKIDDLRANEHAEICAWISGANTQFRISGTMHVLGGQGDSADEEIRKDMWEALPSHTTAFCEWPAPYQPLDKLVEEEASDHKKRDTSQGGKTTGHGTSEESGAKHAVSSNFAVLLLEPSSVDQLLLGSNQKRWEHTKTSDTEWKTQPVTP